MQTYGHELADAHGWCKKFKETRRDADLQQAWDLYYHIFRRINKYLPTVTTLDLRNVSHILAGERDLELAVPGTYIAGAPVVHIARFASKLAVRAAPYSCFPCCARFMLSLRLMQPWCDGVFRSSGLLSSSLGVLHCACHA